MVPLSHLWLPILLSAVLVFLASSLIHMVVKWHASDYRALPQEAAVREALRGADLPPGQYVIPHCADMKDMASEAMRRKYEEGPVGLLMLSPSRVPNLGASLGQWFLYTVLVGFMVAYLASRSFGPAAHYLKVFRLVGAAAFLTYAGGAIPQAIWYGKPWRMVAKDLADGLLYGLVTAGTFGWLWPR